jgi:hypothetical protein
MAISTADTAFVGDPLEVRRGKGGGGPKGGDICRRLNIIEPRRVYKPEYGPDLDSVTPSSHQSINERSKPGVAPSLALTTPVKGSAQASISVNGTE